MFVSRLSRIFRCALLALGLASTLPAQVDPRLTAFKTDFLDQLQRATGITVKPEILTLFDLSGSMGFLTFHPSFPNWEQMESSSSGEFYSIKITANSNDTVSVNLTTNSSGTSLSEIDLGDYYSSKGITGTLYISGVGLVNPAGQLVTAAMAEATKTATAWPRLPGMPTQGFSWVDLDKGKSNAINWLRAASHARFTFSMSGIPDRTIDIPLPWATVLMNSTNTTAPLKRIMITDPTDTAAPQYEVDSTFLDDPLDGVTIANWTTGTSTRPNNASVGNYAGLIRLDYLYWLYTAKDSSNNYYVKSTNAQVTDSTTGNLRTIYPYENGMPTLTRLQALKRATMQVWLNYQDQVYWAFRCLDPDESGSPSPSGNTESSVTIPTDNKTYPGGTNANFRNWVSFNKGMRSKSSGANQYDNGVLRLSKLSAYGGTPLTRALVNSYVQLIDTTNTASHVFAKDGADSSYPCSTSVVMVFTDGVPGDESGSSTYPYTGSTDPVVGNKLVITDADPNKSGRPVNSAYMGGPWFNLPTLGAIAAQSGNTVYGSMGTNYIQSPDVLNLYSGIRSGYPNNSDSMYKFLPFSVVQRGTNKFSSPRTVLTMTVGISLGSSYDKSPWLGGTARALNDTAGASSPKYRLVATAHYGDPQRTLFNMNFAGTYATTKDKYTMPAVAGRPQGAVAPPTCFFDAIDPDSLVSNLQDAIDEAISRQKLGTSTAPVVPYSGLGLGAQVYLASFSPATQGPLWTGDLRMFPTQTAAGSIQILDKFGVQVQGDLMQAIPMWSAADYLDNTRVWSTRKVYTRLPGETTLRNFNPASSGSEFGTIAPYFAIKDLNGATLSTALTLAQKTAIAKFLVGADPADTTKNRSGVMGDVIDSTISVLEYDPATIDLAQLDSALSSKLSGTGAASDARFRVIFVGTNTGFLHAFGEVSYTKSITVGATNPVTIKLVEGLLQELWSFIPTDFLAQIQYLQSTSATHRNLCNGPSFAYQLDLPTGTNPMPDGLVNASTATTNLERAMLVFGLGKGGRSYYAMNVRNPFSPSLAWTLIPDEVAATPSSLTARKESNGIGLTTLSTLVSNMGFSTSRPAVGRVLFPKSGSTTEYQYRDVCFLGGGLSSPELETAFKTGSTTPAMGRSVLGIDIYTGKFLFGADVLALASSTNDKAVIDCIPTGVVPFEFFVGSGLVQRLYFMDYHRGLWCIQSPTVNDKNPDGSTSTYKGFRRDTSLMDKWTTTSGDAFLRKVFTAPANDNFTMLPAPFVVGTYPVARSQAPLIAPAVAGIAIASGDKHNPMDRYYTSTTLPSHRLYVLFDRQDGPLEGLTDTTGIAMTKLLDVTSSTASSLLDTSSPTYFLKPQTTSGPVPYFGYKIDFPASYVPTQTIQDVYRLVPKALNDPLVLVGTLFYSYLKPDPAYDACYGGQGSTRSFRICDFFQPVFTADTASLVNPTPTTGCLNGMVFSWNGLTTQFVARGTQGVNQAGVITTGSGASSSQTIQIKTATTKPSQQWPRVRTWRSVYDY